MELLPNVVFVVMLLAFYVALFVAAVVFGTHLAFHTWRRLERKYPRPPAGS